MPGLGEAIKKGYKKLFGKREKEYKYRSFKPASDYQKTQKENEEAANEGYQLAEKPEE